MAASCFAYLCHAHCICLESYEAICLQVKVLETAKRSAAQQEKDLKQQELEGVFGLRASHQWFHSCCKLHHVTRVHDAGTEMHSGSDTSSNSSAWSNIVRSHRLIRCTVWVRRLLQRVYEGHFWADLRCFMPGRLSKIGSKDPEELRVDFEELINIIVPERGIPKEDLAKVKKQCFPQTSFWVTESRLSDEVTEEGGVLVSTRHAPLPVSFCNSAFWQLKAARDNAIAKTSGLEHSFCH